MAAAAIAAGFDKENWVRRIWTPRVPRLDAALTPGV